MGEANRRAKERERQAEQLRSVNMSRVAGAVRHVASIATKFPGKDCYIHASIGKSLLNRLGVESELVVGFAGWRVGEGSGDAILCMPVTREICLNEGFPCHAWIEIGHNILDLTTYQFSRQAATLEELDGNNVNVSWCPDFLQVKKESVSSVRDLILKNTWCYYYERNLQFEREMSKVSFGLTDDHVDMALAFYQASVADNYLSLNAA
ncbi:MAG: hypothetical protein HXX17_06070 [Geobacteraceae bacterium]|nr:hypothetical protein [Geobacteraceae bacterium]